MARNVYKFPPVRLLGTEWTKVAPISSSRSLLTGKDYTSAAKRVRRVAYCKVAALGHHNAGAGFVEILKELLEGGKHFVRLESFPVNRCMDRAYFDKVFPAGPLTWTTDGNPLAWTTGGNPLTWYTGTPITGTVTTDGGFPALTLTNCPPSMIIARPAEFVTVYEDAEDTTGEQLRVMNLVESDASGNAIVRLMSTPSHGGRVSFGGNESAAFRVAEMPRSTQPLTGQWTYDFNFAEVFADEVEGGFTEVDPWG